VPINVHFLDTRLGVLRDYRKARTEEARELAVDFAGEAQGIRNWMFGLSNTWKANSGRLEALNNPVIMARKADAERKLQAAIAADPALSQSYGGLFARLEEIQAEKRGFASEMGAFRGMGSTFAGSITMARALAADAVLNGKANGVSEEEMAELTEELGRIGDRAPGLEHGFLAHRFADFQRYLGNDHPVTQAALRGTDPEQAAWAMLEESVLDSREATLEAIEAETLGVEDPMIALVAATRARRTICRPTSAAPASRCTEARSRRMGRSLPASRTESLRGMSTTGRWPRRTRPSTACTTATSRTARARGSARSGTCPSVGRLRPRVWT